MHTYIHTCMHIHILLHIIVLYITFSCWATEKSCFILDASVIGGELNLMIVANYRLRSIEGTTHMAVQ